MAEGLAVALPLAIDSIDGAYKLHKDLEGMANQNLKMVILTAPGERIMEPEFGVGTRRFLFEQAIQGNVSVIRDRISEQVGRYLPYIELNELNVYISDNSPSTLAIVIKYSIPAVNIVSETSIIV